MSTPPKARTTVATPSLTACSAVTFIATPIACLPLARISLAVASAASLFGSRPNAEVDVVLERNAYRVGNRVLRPVQIRFCLALGRGRSRFRPCSVQRTYSDFDDHYH